MPQWARRDEAGTRAARKKRKRIRARRPTSLRTKVDREATAKMGFRDKDSYVHLDGRHILHGEDAEISWHRAYGKWVSGGRICGICGNYVCQGYAERDHITSKGDHGYRRDDRDENQQFVHGRFSDAKCHARKHNREVQLGTIPALETWNHPEGAEP